MLADAGREYLKAKGDGRQSPDMFSMNGNGLIRVLSRSSPDMAALREYETAIRKA